MLPNSTYQIKDIAIFGAGGFGREVLMLLHQINQAQLQWNILGFYDDSPETPRTINNYPYLGTLESLNTVKTSTAVVIAIGNPKVKQRIAARLVNPNIFFPVLIHPSVCNESFQFNTIGAGSIICQGNILTTNIRLGRHVILNLGCTVGHDAVIGNFSALMPHVNIAGGAQLGQCVYMGTNATVLPTIIVGSNSIIGAGAVVNKNLPEQCTAVGVPAKIIKQHDA
ncbi:acetyltransferase [Adhaeribacter aquaticus]|uniref:acetyltransferase n=1 Tax=Adhaeribacter aquaticus TaxID=299567 RepID=UPI0004053F24|nr:acetyltransferase [Adhaeribacter aquaticus]